MRWRQMLLFECFKVTVIDRFTVREYVVCRSYDLKASTKSCTLTPVWLFFFYLLYPFSCVPFHDILTLLYRMSIFSIEYNMLFSIF